jgi:hypothetical protein
VKQQCSVLITTCVTHEKWYSENFCYKIMCIQCLNMSPTYLLSYDASLSIVPINIVIRYFLNLRKVQVDWWQSELTCHVIILRCFYSIFKKQKQNKKENMSRGCLKLFFFLALLILFSVSIIWWRHVLDACQDDMSYLYWNYLSLKIFYNLKKNVISEKTLSAYSSIKIVYVLNECDSNKNFNPTP